MAGDVAPALQLTLRQAADRIDQAGGKIEVRRDRLVVSLPPNAATFGREPIDAARVLYMAEPTVAAALKAGDDLPDAPVTPAGALLA